MCVLKYSPIESVLYGMRMLDCIVFGVSGCIVVVSGLSEE